MNESSRESNKFIESGRHGLSQDIHLQGCSTVVRSKRTLVCGLRWENHWTIIHLENEWKRAFTHAVFTLTHDDNTAVEQLDIFSCSVSCTGGQSRVRVRRDTQSKQVHNINITLLKCGLETEWPHSPFPSMTMWDPDLRLRFSFSLCQNHV